MHPVAVGDWTAFFTAQLGAAATLGGLVFVGLSLKGNSEVSALREFFSV
jgi:hypothetical protein